MWRTPVAPNRVDFAGGRPSGDHDRGGDAAHLRCQSEGTAVVARAVCDDAHGGLSFGDQLHSVECATDFECPAFLKYFSFEVKLKS